MTLYFTLTAADRVLAIHQSLSEARDFVSRWVRSDDRAAARIVSADRDDNPVYARSDRFKMKLVKDEISL